MCNIYLTVYGDLPFQTLCDLPVDGGELKGLSDSLPGPFPSCGRLVLPLGYPKLPPLSASLLPASLRASLPSPVCAFYKLFCPFSLPPAASCSPRPLHRRPHISFAYSPFVSLPPPQALHAQLPPFPPLNLRPPVAPCRQLTQLHPLLSAPGDLPAAAQPIERLNSWRVQRQELGQVSAVEAVEGGRLWVFHRGGRIWDENSFDLQNKIAHSEPIEVMRHTPVAYACLVLSSPCPPSTPLSASVSKSLHLCPSLIQMPLPCHPLPPSPLLHRNARTFFQAEFSAERFNEHMPSFLECPKPCRSFPCLCCSH